MRRSVHSVLIRSGCCLALLMGLRGGALLAQSFHQIQADSLRLRSLPTQLIKWDLLSLIQRVGRMSFGGQMTLAYERKFRLAWSGIAEAGLPYRINLSDQPLSLPGLNYQAQINLGLRWYYGLTRRLAATPGLHPFSANYVSVVGRTHILPRFQTSGSSGVAYWFTDGLSIGMTYGIQRRLSTESYFDIQGGLLISQDQRDPTAITWQWTPLVSIRLGLAR